MSHAAEIIARYRDRGLRGKELKFAVNKHARLLERLDGQVASSLRMAWLWQDSYRYVPRGADGKPVRWRDAKP
jgi:hypothetical protein